MLTYITIYIAKLLCSQKTFSLLSVGNYHTWYVKRKKWVNLCAVMESKLHIGIEILETCEASPIEKSLTRKIALLLLFSFLAEQIPSLWQCHIRCFLDYQAVAMQLNYAIRCSWSIHAAKSSQSAHVISLYSEVNPISIANVFSIELMCVQNDCNLIIYIHIVQAKIRVQLNPQYSP